MPVKISIAKGTSNPTSSTGLTLGEPAFNYSNNTLWMGKGSGNTPVWLGAGICGASGGIAAGLTYQIPTLGAVKDYFSAVSSAFLGTTASYVATFNGLTGAIQGVSAAVAGSYITVSAATGSVTITNTGVQTFNGLTGTIQGVSSWNGQTGAVSFVNYVSSFNGITGAVTGVSSIGGLTGALTPSAGTGIGVATAGTTITITNTGVQSFNGATGAVTGVCAAVAGTGISVSGATGSVTITNIGVQSFNGRTGAVQGVSSAAAGTGISISAATGAITITNTGVQTFNGLTGAVTGVTVGGANTFTALNSFAVGISSNGGTFSASTRFLSGIQTDSVLSTNGAGGNVYINSDAIGNGGNSVTFIGDWNNDNNGTSITVDDTTGTVTINPSVSTGLVYTSQVTTTGGVFFGGSVIHIDSESTTLGTTAANQTISSTQIYDGLTDTNRSFEFFVQASTASAFEAIKIIAIHDGTNTYNTQYGVIRSGSSLCSSYTTTIATGGGGKKNLYLRATPTNTNTTFKVVKTVIPA